MKKKHFLMMLIISLPLFFTGCVEDMYEDSVSMEDLYRQKAAEFSKKYGVDVTLNEDKISEIVTLKTFDKIELDIKNLSIQLHGMQVDSLESSPPLKNKMKISKRKSLSEGGGIYPTSGDRAAIFSCNIMRYDHDGNGYEHNLSGTIKVDWSYLANNRFVKITIHKCSDGSYGEFKTTDQPYLIGGAYIKIDITTTIEVNYLDIYYYKLPVSVKYDSITGQYVIKINNVNRSDNLNEYCDEED